MSFLMIANNISQYHSPIYKRLPSDVTLACLSKIGIEPIKNPISGSTQVLDGYFHEELNPKYYKNASQIYSGFWSRINIGLIAEVICGKWPKVMVHGHSTFTNVFILLLGYLPYIKVYWRGESVVSKNRNFLKMFTLKFLFKPVCGAVYSHHLNKGFLTSVGLKENVLHFSPSCVDVDFFKSSHSPPHLNRFVFIGKFIERKNIVPIMMEFLRQCQKVKVEIILIGGGTLTQDLMELAIIKNPKLRITVLNFLNQNEIKNVLSQTSLLFLPSLFDSSPKVIHEAFACNVPVVISSGVQTAKELASIGPKVVKVVNLGDKFEERFVNECYKLHNELSAIKAQDYLKLNELYNPERWIEGFEKMRENS